MYHPPCPQVNGIVCTYDTLPFSHDRVQRENKMKPETNPDLSYYIMIDLQQYNSSEIERQPTLSEGKVCAYKTQVKYNKTSRRSRSVWFGCDQGTAWHAADFAGYTGYSMGSTTRILVSDAGAGVIYSSGALQRRTSNDDIMRTIITQFGSKKRRKD